MMMIIISVILMIARKKRSEGNTLAHRSMKTNNILTGSWELYDLHLTNHKDLRDRDYNY